MTLQNDDFFWFSVSSWGTHLWSLFTFPVCFKCHMTVEWLMLSSLATSRVVVRGSPTMITLSCHCLLPVASHYSSSLRLSSPLQKFLNHHCSEPCLAVPGPSEFLMLQAVSTALRPILNSNKKLLNFAFCQTSFL